MRVKHTQSATHRLLSDGLPEIDLLETAGGLVENLLAVLEAENLLAEDEKLRQRLDDGERAAAIGAHTHNEEAAEGAEAPKWQGAIKT